MSKEPPNCYICNKNYADSADRLHYCICDTVVCDKCVSVKNDNVWICPKCKNENDVEKSRLFRSK